MQQATDDQVVILTADQWKVILNTMGVLYGVTALGPDKKRDQANYMEANLRDVLIVEIEDLCENWLKQ